MRHGLVARKARIAGLLHDLARLYSPRQLLDECAARGLTTDDLERASPILLHARLGAELAREDFGVTDPEVLSAIAKHTHGDGAMSALDCVVYLADSLEPERHFPERAGLWKLAQRDLPAAMHGTLASMILYLEGRGLAPAPQAIAALRSFERAATQKETERCRS
jgi:predicted HD superfamily hydrolase involved in NAD metabolism